MAKQDPDLQYQAYEQGMKEARSLIRSVYLKSGDDNIIDLALEDWPLHMAQDVDTFLDNCSDEEYYKFAKNFIDGMEDGFKSALPRWLRKWKDENKL